MCLKTGKVRDFAIFNYVSQGSGGDGSTEEEANTLRNMYPEKLRVCTPTSCAQGRVLWLIIYFFYSFFFFFVLQNAGPDVLRLPFLISLVSLTK